MDHSMKDLLNEGKENLTKMLTRDQPDSGMDLFIRGHEKIGEFLCKTHRLISSDYFDNRIWENEVNPWSIKILSKMGFGSSIDKFKISRLLRLLAEQKTTNFSGKSNF